MLTVVVLVLLSLVGPLMTASLPNVTVDHQDGNLQFKMPNAPGLTEVFFNYMLSSLSNMVPQTAQATQGSDGTWQHKVENANMNVGEQVQFSVFAMSGSMGRVQSPVTSWTNAPSPTTAPNTAPNTAPTTAPTTSTPRTMTTLGPRVPSAVVFRDDFNGVALDRNDWRMEVSMYGGMNWEFQVYTNQDSNVYLKGGNLFLKPTLTVDDPKFDENFLTQGTMDVAAIWGVCTNSGNYGCSREGRYGLLPPIMSGKVTTFPAIKYGTVEVRARIPKGDWIWPAIWMLPKSNKYGGWPRSGEIDIMETRGNAVARSADGVNHGINEISSTLHWGASSTTNHYDLTHAEKAMPSGDWHSAFHTWKLTWTADSIVTTVDGEEILRVTLPPSGGFYAKGNMTGQNPWASGTDMAPFDEEFFLILNVAVGGTVGFFPDDFDYGVEKPWKNDSPSAAADYWARRSDWEKTWSGDNTAMEIDYIEMRHL
ncbi:beta-1,3-glucan-binding protein-like [Littorina saxatilis]|uniref:GH16 domain-containing protein n=1 Tax=Littorina saxatilis TaxID=31220 RepID=A0AAN9C177_9CAEN